MWPFARKPDIGQPFYGWRGLRRRRALRAYTRAHAAMQQVRNEAGAEASVRAFSAQVNRALNGYEFLFCLEEQWDMADGASNALRHLNRLPNMAQLAIPHETLIAWFNEDTQLPNLLSI